MLESAFRLGGIFLGAMLFVLIAVLIVYGIFTIIEMIVDDIRELIQNGDDEDYDE